LIDHEMAYMADSLVPGAPASSTAGRALRRLRLRHLQVLHVLRDVPTVHGAAQALSLSQPAVSKMLQEIEEVCGMRLFERTRRGVVATEAGALMTRYATAIVNDLHAAGDRLAALDRAGGALLHVGSFSTMALLPLAIAELRREVPGVIVRLHEMPPRAMVEGLVAGELDCIVGALPPDVLSEPGVDGLKVEPILEDRLCVVCAPGHALSGERRVAWRDVVAHDWVLPGRDALMRQALIGACLQHGLRPPEPVVESLSALTTRWLVRFDPGLLGVMRLHQASEEAALGLLRVLPVAPQVPLPRIALISRRDAALSRGLVAEFGRALRAVRGSPALAATVPLKSRSPRPAPRRR